MLGRFFSPLLMLAAASSRPLRVLLAIDKFKDSLDAAGVARAVALGLEQSQLASSVSQLSIDIVCMSDGGEGFLHALEQPLALCLRSVRVTGPLGSPLDASYGIAHGADGKLAVIEMARASGLELVPPAQRNPLLTTSRGTGELVADAIAQGCSRILLGVGGSATSDGGLGALGALGLSVTCEADERGERQPVVIFGRNVAAVRELHLARWPLLPPQVQQLDIACDVSNPFVGALGAVRVFAAQKGATPEMQEALEAGMVRLAALVHQHTGVAIADLPGAGAAGGIAGSFHALLGASLVRGIRLIAEAHRLEERIRDADLVITGEGSYDAQTAGGKVVAHVLELALQHAATRPMALVVVCGRAADDIPHQPQVDVVPLLSRFPIEYAMQHTAEALTEITRQVIAPMVAKRLAISTTE